MSTIVGVLGVLAITFAFWMFNLWDWHRLMYPNETFLAYLRKRGKR